MHAFIKDWDILIRATEGSLYPWIKGSACWLYPHKKKKKKIRWVDSVDTKLKKER